MISREGCQSKSFGNDFNSTCYFKFCTTTRLFKHFFGFHKISNIFLVLKKKFRNTLKFAFLECLFIQKLPFFLILPFPRKYCPEPLAVHLSLMYKTCKLKLILIKNQLHLRTCQISSTVFRAFVNQHNTR